MDKKILIVVIIVAILAVSSIAAYVALSGDDGSNGSTDNGATETEPTETEPTETEPTETEPTETEPTETEPTETEPTETEPETSESENGGGTEVDVGSASSLQFKVSVDPADSESVESEWMIKNAGTSSLMMRIDMESAGEEFIYIINGAQEKVWICSDGEWMELSSMYQSYWDTWSTTWEGYRTSLIDWTGYGEWSYTTPDGDSVRIYDINVNPSLSDSLFQH
jgi:hypothetical protein